METIIATFFCIAGIIGVYVIFSIEVAALVLGVIAIFELNEIKGAIRSLKDD